MMGQMIDDDVLARENPVVRLASENPVVIFSMTTCCMCITVKRLFCTIGVLNPTVYELDLEPAGEEVQKSLIQLQLGEVVPVVFVGGQLVGSVDQVLAAHINGSLVPLLVAAGVDLAWPPGHVKSSNSDELLNGQSEVNYWMVESSRSKKYKLDDQVQDRLQVLSLAFPSTLENARHIHPKRANHSNQQLHLLGASATLKSVRASLNPKQHFKRPPWTLPLHLCQETQTHSRRADYSCQELEVLDGNVNLPTLQTNSYVPTVKPVQSPKFRTTSPASETTPTFEAISVTSYACLLSSIYLL